MARRNLPIRGGEPEYPPPGPVDDWAFHDLPPDNVPMGEGGSSIEWRRYLSAIWRFKWLVLLLVVLGTAVGVVAARYVEPQYQTQATIWIEGGDQSGRGPIRPSELLRNTAWVDLLKSYRVLEPVVREKRLHIDLQDPADSVLVSTLELSERHVPGKYRLEVGPEGERYTLYGEGDQLLERGAVGDSIGLDLGFLWQPPASALEGGRNVEFELGSPREAASELASNLRTALDENGTFMDISLRGQDPERIASILNAITERYMEVASDLKSAALEERTLILASQLQRSRQQLERAETELEDYRVETITLPSERASPVTPGVKETRDPAFTNFFQMRLEREDLRRDREAIESVLASAGSSGLSVEKLEFIPAVQNSAELSSALSELTDKRAQLRALRQDFTDQHLPVRNMLEQVQHLEQDVIPELASQVAAQLRNREAEIERRLASASDELSEIPPRAIDEAGLERDVQSAAELFTNLQSRYEEARLAAASQIPDVSVLDRAVTPRRPVNQNEEQMLILLAFAGSLGLGLLGAVLLDRFDSKFKYPEEISHDLGLSILGSVPHVGGRGRVDRLAANSEVIEAFRVIRLNLEHAYGRAGPVVITVTSPASGEGKTFVTANLALAFSELGRRTLLIDADVRRGSLHRYLGCTRKPGLIDYLAGRAEMHDVIQATSYDSLYCLGCGTRRQDAPELLQSGEMSAFLVQLRSQFDVILIDTPPLAAGVDPLAMGTLTGNLLIVLRTGTTDRGLASAKLDMMEHLPIRLLGAILNDVRPKGVYQYYGYLPGYETWDEDEDGGVGTGRRGRALPVGNSGSASTHAETEGPEQAEEEEPDLEADERVHLGYQAYSSGARYEGASEEAAEGEESFGRNDRAAHESAESREGESREGELREENDSRVKLYREHQRRHHIRYWR